MLPRQYSLLAGYLFGGTLVALGFLRGFRNEEIVSLVEVAIGLLVIYITWKASKATRQSEEKNKVPDFRQRKMKLIGVGVFFIICGLFLDPATIGIKQGGLIFGLVDLIFGAILIIIALRLPKS